MSTYVYALTGADQPLPLEELRGVGEPAAALRTVRGRELMAVVSDAPDRLRAKRRDVSAHQEVVEALMRETAVLPMRFGLVAPDDEQLSASLIERESAYQQRLEEIAGHAEYNLKASRDEEDLLREILRDSEPARQLNERIRTGQGTHEDRVALGELVSGEVAARHRAAAERVENALSSCAAEAFLGEGAEGHFMNTSFLVPKEREALFHQTVRTTADEAGEAYTFTLTGPLPPYSFV
ncbi:GvpL/GvpF family gas vesicle protein [Streptomyces physcomitrii]|uniref:GvpL/GvpF family gas vesicle protein n=1 Tax=Streptomyces physcomitrii TaxID=2724184 RepID=UPI0033F8182E